MKQVVMAALFLGMMAVDWAQAATTVEGPVHIDFSFAGYEGGHSAPRVSAVIAVRPSGKDDTALLQSAIDHVASLPMAANGFRGAVLLRPGKFHVRGLLRIEASGIVLRGAGAVGRGTTIIAEGNSRRTLLQVGGSSDPLLAEPMQIADETVPVGARAFAVADTSGLAIGDHVVIRRPSTEEWIGAIAMSGLPGTFANLRLDWKAGSHDLLWDRTITAIDASTKRIEVDAPITTAIEKRYGGGSVAKITGNAPLDKIGIEDLLLESSYDNRYPKDEEHAWIAVALDHVEDAWVQNVTARHFVSSAVRAGLRARRITIRDCRSESPVSEVGGYRRQSFLVYGQQVLVYRCHSEAGMNDFASGLLAAGPNAFLDCDATGSLGASGAFEGWSSGVLYENVHVPQSRIQFLLDQLRAQGAGWTAANSVLWNSTALSVDAIGPPGAPNFKVQSPAALYETQLEARGLHLAVASARDLSPEERVPDFTEVAAKPESQPARHQFDIVNGRFVIDGQAVWGESQNEAWWRADTSPSVAAQLTGSSISRFMPGQTGPGMTEDLQELLERMKKRNVAFYVSIPGLWYEHRRDAHTLTRQPDGDVWAPFFEMPWARSGKGVAWDGLSLFDVSRYNPWYFERHREFAKLAAQQQVIVFVDLYNNHNVLEIGPHWIDFPWRPANNVNDTGLPEPPPLKPRDRLDVGNEFFSVAYAPLRKLHHDYIFHTLDQLGDLPNVIFGVAYQYAGPLAFEQFFQDTIAEWEQQHGRHIRVALTTSKQTTDAILADPVRSKQIAVVDMRYWEYQPDGTLFAPRAGENHAFREQISAQFKGYTDTPPPTTPEQVYRQVREYRDRYPDKALLAMENGAGPLPILMGGAASQSSLRARSTSSDESPSQDDILDKFVHENLGADLMKMGPLDGIVEDAKENWVLGGAITDAVLIYSRAGSSIAFIPSLSRARYKGIWFDPATGNSKDTGEIHVVAGAIIKKPDDKAWLLLLHSAK